MNRKYLFIDGFFLKIIAFVLMTLDHVGIFLIGSNSESLVQMGEIFRLFGRFAFPLFVLMLVEGVRHTKSFARYALRLGIVATIVLIAQVVIYYNFDNSISSAYSPLLDLLCYGTFLYLISRKDKLSFLAIIPAGLVILSFVIGIIEGTTDLTIKWFPFYVRSGYNIFGFIMAIMMYFAYPLLKKLFESYHMDTEDYEETGTFRMSLNVCFAFSVFFAVVVIYLIAKIDGADLFGVNSTAFSETWALVAIPIILFYSGKRGYNAKWFQYASYLYFPLHLVIIYFVFYMLSLGGLL